MDSSKDTHNIEDHRPSLDDLRDVSYNRFTVSDNLKSQICSQIADSSESLPLWQAGDYDGSHDNNVHANTAASKLGDTSDIATPMPEKGNPMDNLDLGKEKTATPLSNVSTAQSTHSKADKDRPSTLRRLTTRIKRTISTQQSK
jgi:hypothetical protein